MVIDSLGLVSSGNWCLYVLVSGDGSMFMVVMVCVLVLCSVVIVLMRLGFLFDWENVIVSWFCIFSGVCCSVVIDIGSDVIGMLRWFIVRFVK